MTGTPGSRRVGTAEELTDSAEELLGAGYRLGLAAAHDDGAHLRVVYLFLAGRPDRRVELEYVLPAEDPVLPSLAYLSFPAGRFEREAADLYGIRLRGHPRPRRLVRHAHWPQDWHPMRADADAIPDFNGSGELRFLTVTGNGVYEIPVGPVHAGLIEPGHFRFSVVGETVVRLKARLWYVHRGIEKLFEGRSATGAGELAERVSGDSSAAHALAHSLAVEDACGIAVSGHVHRLRALVVELERLYNHAADLGALANDVGFGLANAHALRIREQLLRINASVTGHRLLRGAIRPGGVALQGLPDTTRLASLAADLAEVTELTLRNAVIYDRFAGTGVLAADDAVALGCLGYPARASGVITDARLDHPTVALPVTEVRAEAGDVLARYTVRRDEFAASIQLVTELAGTHSGALELDTGGPGGGSLRNHAGPSEAPQFIGAPGRGDARSGVGIVEGWRGTIVHRVEVDHTGRLTRAKIVDPSWFNWPAVPVAMNDTIVPDFPLVNKSFNLSYAGNDL
jgi:Ni,Fe-hydrogenase III large subunit/Ni,Fe-hydrogenase III component G